MVAVLAAIMWFLPGPRLEIPYRVQISLLVAFSGALLLGIAAWEFRRARTTINPMTPGKSSALVTRGVFAWSRNPIYVADAVLLLALAIYLGSAFSLLGIPLFVLYINRFQIAPEEKALASLFGKEYEDYCRRVRRWI